MINQSCQERSLLLQYLIASTPDPIPETDVILDTNDLTETKIQQVLAQPYIDVASINITGPLIVFQNFISTNDITFPNEPIHVYWPYHHAVVINVEGNVCIIDLSIQDGPIPVSEWTTKLCSETTCGEVSEQEYWEIWSYWLSLMNNWQVEETPEKLCGYTTTPMLTFRSDQEPQIQGLIDSLSTLVVQTYAFQTLIMDTYGINAPFESIPFITSLYTLGTIDDLCSWVSFLFCQQE
ncbi:MAG: protein-glutamine glutaminase family protein [Candidatus Hydrogenedens sp.]